MLYCKPCKAKIAGVHEHCPLCGGNLSGEPEKERSYPIIAPNPNRIKRIIQILSISAIAGAIICVAINVLVPAGIWWSLFAVLGLACGWLWAVVGILKKAKLLNNIVWQCVLISALAFFVGCRYRMARMVCRVCIPLRLYRSDAGGHYPCDRVPHA